MKQHYTILFNTFVWMNLFNMLACRKIGWSDVRLHEHLFNNKWFFFVLAIEVVLQWFIIEFPGLNEIFRTTHLRWSMHITCFTFGFGALVVNIAAKKVFNDEAAYAPFFEFKMSEDPNEQENKFLKYSQQMQSTLQKQEDLDHSCDSSLNECLIHNNDVEKRL